MKLGESIARCRRSAIAGVFAVGTMSLIVQGCTRRLDKVRSGKFPEELVFVQSKDQIVDAGAMFTPQKDSIKPIGVIWIHGWGVNFYQPGYVMVGRALAERGYATIIGNTRMHDIGNVAGERWGKRIRGGGYWGVTSEESRDIAAWIDFASDRGFKKVVLVGHSAGWVEVARYEMDTQDPRVVGLVLASGAVRPDTQQPDSQMLAQSIRLVAQGRGDDLLRFPEQHRKYPSFVSAATYLDIARAPAALKDFFGVRTPNPGVTRVHCPLLGFFASKDDVGDEADLELLRSSVQRHRTGPPRVTTVMIEGGDHMYTGEEAQVAQTITSWADGLLKADSSGSCAG
jgi:pimeloyl-ACP methyl ester carboxylesterase